MIKLKKVKNFLVRIKNFKSFFKVLFPTIFLFYQIFSKHFVIDWVKGYLNLSHYPFKDKNYPCINSMNRFSLKYEFKFTIPNMWLKNILFIDLSSIGKDTWVFFLDQNFIVLNYLLILRNWRRFDGTAYSISSNHVLMIGWIPY